MAGMHSFTGGGWGEQTQDRLWNNPWEVDWANYWGLQIPDFGPRRGAPAELPYREYDPVEGGWWQGDRKLRNFKPKYFYTRPCDGKRRGTMGRLKDALSLEGPDVYVTMSGDRRTLMRDRPQRWQWSGWGQTARQQTDKFWDKDWRQQDDMPIMGAEGDNERYNFRSRQFRAPRLRDVLEPNNDRLWVDARWHEGARRSSMNPLSRRYHGGLETTRVPRTSGHFAGGRPIGYRY